jgi:acyl-CoA dehydrogenase
LLTSTHAIDREFREITALQGTAIPVPRIVAWCGDEKLIGTPFYVMAFVSDRVLLVQSLPGMGRTARAVHYQEMNRVISELLAVDLRRSDWRPSENRTTIPPAKWRAGYGNVNHLCCRYPPPCGG